MHFRHSIRCPGVRQQVLAASDSVWLSEELLADAFQRFWALPRPLRRHGSSVPGPMESRRRSGKRRMTYQSEATAAATNNQEIGWGYFGKVDRTQWQWKPPTPRKSETGLDPAPLPAWLLEWRPPQYDGHDGSDGQPLVSTNTAAPENTTSNDVDLQPPFTGVRESDGDRSSMNNDIEHYIEEYRKELRNPSNQTESHLDRITFDFNKILRREISYGHLHADSLCLVLRSLTEEMQQNFLADYPSGLSIRCISLYEAVLQGMLQSQVMKLHDYDYKVFELMLSYIKQLPLTQTSVQELARNIFASLSSAQLDELVPAIGSLADTWMQSAMDSRFNALDLRYKIAGTVESVQCALANFQAELENASRLDGALRTSQSIDDAMRAREAISRARKFELVAQDALKSVELILEFGDSLVDASILTIAKKAIANSSFKLKYAELRIIDVQAAPRTMTQAISTASKALSSARTALALSEQAVGIVSLAVSPSKASTKALSDVLQALPEAVALRVILARMDNVLATGSQWFRKLRYSWLLVVADITFVDSMLLLQIWQKLETRGGPLSSASCGDILLRHWICQGVVTKATAVGTQYDILQRNAEGSENFANLIYALDKHRQDYISRTWNIFSLLHELGRFEAVTGIVEHLTSMNIRLPASLMAQSIKIMAQYDAQHALKLFNLSEVMLKGRNKPPAISLPEFVLAIIDQHVIESNEIWNLLGIRWEVRHGVYRPRRHKRPCPTEVSLIHKMALAWANSPTWTRRAALRNIQRCVDYLRFYRQATGPQLGVAIAHNVITESILKGQWVAPKRFHYALSIVSKTQGQDMARKTDFLVYKWREHLTAETLQTYREMHVLRRGRPID